MTRRKINQIQESLLEQYKVWRRGSGTDLPPLEGGGGFGLGGVTTSRMPTNVIGPKIPTSSKPRVSPEQARELGILKPQPKVWRRGESSVDDARKRAEAFLSGQGFKTQSEPSSISKPSMAPEPRTPQERLVAQAQLAQRGQGTAEPATVRDLIAAVPGLTKTKIAGAIAGGSLIGAGLGLKGAELLSDPSSAEQERSKWLQKFDAGLQKSDQEQQEMRQRIERDQKIADELTAKTRKQKPMKENKTTRTLEQIEQDLRARLSEQTATPTQSRVRQMMQPMPVPKSQLREPTSQERELAGLLPGVGTALDVKDIASGDYSAAPYMALGLLPGGGLIKKGVKKLRQKFGKADDYDFASAVTSRTPKKGDPVPGIPGQYYTGEITAAGKPKTTSVAPATKPSEPTVKAEPEALPAAASKPVTEPIPKKPFLQSKDEYLRGLSKDELERLELVKKMQKGDLLKKGLIGGGLTGTGYGLYKGVPVIWQDYQKTGEFDPLGAFERAGKEKIRDVITTPVPGSTVPDIYKDQSPPIQQKSKSSSGNSGPIQGSTVPDIYKDKQNEAAEKPTYTREQYLGWAKKYAEQYDVPLPMVLHAMFKETGWLRNAERMRTAESPKGALGVMQILPKYAEKGAYKIKVEDLLDPEKNIEAGVRGLSYFFNKYKTVEKALAAYNAGEGGAARFLKTGDVRTLPTAETRKYVAAYKDDVIHQLEKFFPKDKKKIEQVATDILGIATGTQIAKAADQASVAVNSPDKTTSVEKTNISTKTQTGKPVGSTYTTTDTQGRTTTYTKNATGQWVSKSGEILPMPVSPVPAPAAPSSATDKQPAKDSESSWFEKLYRIPQAKEVQARWAAEVDKKSKAPGTVQSVASAKPDAGVPKSPTYQPLLTIEKEKREREQAKKSNKPMQPPSFDPELDPKGWAEYEEYMQQRQIDAGDKFSREREARLAREKQQVDKKSSVTEPKIELQRDQAGLVKAKRKLSDFEKAFAAARAEQGASGTFSYTDPKTRKTGVYTTLYKGEKTPSKPEVVAEPVAPEQSINGPELQANTPDEIEKIINDKQTNVTPDAPMPTDAEIEAAKARSQKHLADIERELADKALVKEAINTESHALHEILRLAGRTK